MKSYHGIEPVFTSLLHSWRLWLFQNALVFRKFKPSKPRKQTWVSWRRREKRPCRDCRWASCRPGWVGPENFPSQPQLGRFLFPLRLCCCMYTIICELKASEAQFYWLQPWFYTYQTQLMPAGNKAKCTKLSALMEKRGLIHIAWPLLGPPSLLFVVSFLWIMFVYLRPSLSLCSLFVGFTQQLCRAQISMFKYAVKQFMLNKPDGMFSSETVFLAKVARSEMFRAPDLCCTLKKTPKQTPMLVCRMWRGETRSWRGRSRVPRRHWHPARRGRLRQKWRCGASSRSWTWRSATWVTWDGAWPSSSLTNQQSKPAADTQDRGFILLLRLVQVNSRYSGPL